MDCVHRGQVRQDDTEAHARCHTLPDCVNHWLEPELRLVMLQCILADHVGIELAKRFTILERHDSDSPSITLLHLLVGATAFAVLLVLLLCNGSLSGALWVEAVHILIIDSLLVNSGARPHLTCFLIY